MVSVIQERHRQIVFAGLLSLLFASLLVPAIWWMRDIISNQVNPYVDGEAASLRFRYSWPIASGGLMAALFFVRSARTWFRGVVVPAILAVTMIFPMVYITVPLSFLINFLSLWMIGFLQFILPTAFAIVFVVISNRFGSMQRWGELPWIERYLICSVFIASEAIHLFGYWVKNDWYYTVI